MSTVFVADCCAAPALREISRLLAQQVVAKSAVPPPTVTADGASTITSSTDERSAPEQLSHRTVIGSHSPRTPTPTPTQTRMPATTASPADSYAGPCPPCPWLSQLVPNDRGEAMQAAMAQCDTLIFDVMADWELAQWALEYCQKVAQADRPKTFILLSNVLTWAKTPAPQAEEGATEAAVLMEEDYRKRRSHANFKNQLQVEKLVMKAGAVEVAAADDQPAPPSQPLKTYVVNSGMVYHVDDGVIHSYLKDAWLGAQLFCYGSGENTIPSIYLADFARIVVEVATSAPDKRYILAVDDGKHTLMQMLRAISDNVGSGAVLTAPREEAFLRSDWSPVERDMLQVNLRMEPGFVKALTVDWKYELGLVENVTQFIAEYKAFRDLKPINIYVTGPPLSGKTTLAKQLAEKYELHYVDVDRITADAIAVMEKKTIQLQDEVDAEIEALKVLVNQLHEYARANDGRYPSEQVIIFVRDFLRTMPCRNQGYVLDGFGRSPNDLQQLFLGAGGGEEVDDEKTAAADSANIPSTVVLLQCPEELSKERYAQLPGTALTGRNAEDAFFKRLEEYHRGDDSEGHDDGTSILTFFDEHDIVPIAVPVSGTAAAGECLETVVKEIGQPRNYGPSYEKMVAQRELEATEAARRIEQQRVEQQKLERLEQDRLIRLQQETMMKQEEVKKQEALALESQSAPLRNYLVQNVMPSLTAGLIELCKVRPADPIDFLVIIVDSGY